MPVKRVFRGNGITKSKAFIVAVGDMAEADYFRRGKGQVKLLRWRELRRGPNGFEAVHLGPILRRCAAFFEKAGGKRIGPGHYVMPSRPIEDSEEDFALRILIALDAAQRRIADGDIRRACVSSYELGRLITQFQMKLEWEHDALQGRKKADQLRASGVERRIVEKAKAAKQHKKWQHMADDYWKRHPERGFSDAARYIAGRIGGNQNTIRRAIGRK